MGADPVTAGLIIAGVGGVMSSMAQSEALDAEADTARRNAQLTKMKTEADAENQVIQARKFLGEQAAGYAASGVEGASVFAVMADSMVNAEMDRLSIILGGDVRSRNFMAEAESKIKASRNVQTAGIIGAIGDGFMAAGKAKKNKTFTTSEGDIDG